VTIWAAILVLGIATIWVAFGAGMAYLVSAPARDRSGGG
jgi:hypothetical protein